MDIQFIGKGKSKTQGGAVVVPPPSPNTVEGLTGTDLTLSIDQKTLYVKKSNTTVATIVVRKIVTWEIKSSTINIINGDPTILSLIFVSNAERNIALAVLENAMNIN